MGHANPRVETTPVPERIRVLASGAFDRDGWLDLGRAIARDQGLVAWEAAYWARYGPDRLGNWAYQYLGDASVDPADDPDAVFPQSGRTLRNYATTAGRFPPSVLYQAGDGGTLRWPDVIPAFTIWQELTPADLEDAFVFRVLDCVQAAHDARAEWDAAAAAGRAEGDRPGLIVRADVRRAVRAYRDGRDRAAVEADPDTPPVESDDAGLVRATQAAIAFPTPPHANPFVDGPAPRQVPFGFGVPLSSGVFSDDARDVRIQGVRPIWTEVVEGDADGDRILVHLDRDAVRETVLEALDALPGADGLTLADWIADHLEGGDA